MFTVMLLCVCVFLFGSRVDVKEAGQEWLLDWGGRHLHFRPWKDCQAFHRQENSRVGLNGDSISGFRSGIPVTCYLNVHFASWLQGNEGPFYVSDLDTLVRMHMRWLSNLSRVKPFYAVKCNSSPTVLRTLNALGTGFDCASKVLANILENNKFSRHLSTFPQGLLTWSLFSYQGEISQVLALGVKPENIIYAHTTKPQSHIKYACARGINLMTFDDEDELRKISLHHPKAK